jgi:hypothetical protein
MESLAVRCYGEISRHYSRDASFIANVLLTGCSRPGTRLKELLRRLRAGQQFNCLPFRMPYEGFFIDGIAVRMEILDSPGAAVGDFVLVDSAPQAIGAECFN